MIISMTTILMIKILIITITNNNDHNHDNDFNGDWNNSKDCGKKD